ncbi:MAG: TerB family tellurite resistance protein, partial [Polyangiaceae bacterium]|nr:TerB family tellurite resistance protein [Polyangiaceae bacterium]
GLDVALGRAARNAAPVPSNWALAWAVSQSSLRMPARRCPVEFESLFHLQYRLAFGDGFVPEGRVQKQVFSYRPSSSTFGQAELTVPVDGLPSATDPGYCRIIDIVERCMTDLDPFSRWRGKHPDGPVTMDGLAFLPVGLVLTYPTAFPPEIQAFRQLLESALARTDIATDIAPDIATVDSKGVLSHWPMADLAKPTKAEAIQFAQVCERLGFGVEPDIRFGGASPLTGNSLVLFRLGVDAPSEPSPEYKSAALVLLLMAAVIHADGVVTSEERTQMEAQAAYVSGLSSAEHVRIRAHAEWLLASPPSLTGLKKRLSALPATVRDDLADFLVAAATADGEVSPEEVTVIKRMFAMLGLDSASMYSRLHAAVAEIAPSADAPVRVSTGGPERLFAISEPPPVESPFDRSQTRTQEPDTSARSKPLSAQSATPSKPKRVTFALDMTAIQQKLAESARVAEILSGIFDDEAEKPVALSAPPLPQSAGVPVSSSASSGETIWTLDAKHSSLLRALLGHDSWSRDAVEDLCASFNLLTDGALETINEAAFDAVGEPVIEGSDPLELNKYALETIVP